MRVDGDKTFEAPTEECLLLRVRVLGDRVRHVEPIAIGARIRDAVRHGDGTLLLWTEAGDGLALRPRR